ncbi:MAG: Asp-tRNA(Asn)/Glu-tRNA(Gln) amidotransferase subunit GatC [Selenomonadaceae bacterium]|nr:Asp-tRNA(Asn)/Glu-tRNA(Gln) amidotransferase subunit GatC [Selenomonadaceae bacterium]
MKVSKEILANVAGLSRLAIAEEETTRYQEDLTKFLAYVETLNEVATENTPPTTYALPMENVFREDDVRPSLDREAALLNAPLKEDGYFKVPKVLED